MDRFMYRDHLAMKAAGKAPAHDPRVTQLELVRERQQAIRERQSAVREAEELRRRASQAILAALVIADVVLWAPILAGVVS